MLLQTAVPIVPVAPLHASHSAVLSDPHDMSIELSRSQPPLERDPPVHRDRVPIRDNIGNRSILFKARRWSRNTLLIANDVRIVRRIDCVQCPATSRVQQKKRHVSIINSINNRIHHNNILYPFNSLHVISPYLYTLLQLFDNR